MHACSTHIFFSCQCLSIFETSSTIHARLATQGLNKKRQACDYHAAITNVTKYICATFIAPHPASEFACMYAMHLSTQMCVCVYTYAYACMHVYRREQTWRGPALRQSCIKVRSACDLRCRVNNFTRRQASSVYLHRHDNTGMTHSRLLFLCHPPNSLQASSLFRHDPIPILDSMGLARALDPSPAKVLGARSFVRPCRLSFANC